MSKVKIETIFRSLFIAALSLDHMYAWEMESMEEEAGKNTFPNLDTECYFSCIFNHALNHMQLPYWRWKSRNFFFFVCCFSFYFHVLWCVFFLSISLYFDKFHYTSMCMGCSRQRHTKGRLNI